MDDVRAINEAKLTHAVKMRRVEIEERQLRKEDLLGWNAVAAHRMSLLKMLHCETGPAIHAQTQARVCAGSPPQLGNRRGAGTLLNPDRRGPRDRAVSCQIDARSSCVTSTKSPLNAVCVGVRSTKARGHRLHTISQPGRDWVSHEGAIAEFCVAVTW